MSDAFSDTQQRFAHRIKDGRVCHTLLPTLNKFEKVSNSPTQRSELKTNPDILDLFWNNRLSRASSPRQLSHLVGGGLDSFPSREEASAHGRIQLSPSCRSPFQRPVAVWLRASTSNATFVTLKRRQLLLSHVVPSVSDAQKKNLLLTRSSRQALFSLLRLWRLLALRLVTCPCLSHILRPPRRRLHLVVHHILALRPREALLDNFLDNLLRSDPLPLSDCSLARRAIRASRRSPPQPPTTGRL